MSKIPLAQIYDVNDIRLDMVDTPTAGPNDVVIAVAICGICGTDVGFYKSGSLFGPGNPMPIGHEFAGTVHQAGANVKQYKQGDRVVVNPDHNLIGSSGPEGAFTPYLLVKDVVAAPHSLLPMPDNMSFAQGALVEPLAVAMHGLNKGQITSNDNVVIFGAGPIGLCAALILQYRGVSDVVVVDMVDSRLQLAQSFGATTFNPTTGDDLATFLQQHHGSGDVMGNPAPGSDVYLEATGVGAVFTQILNTAKRDARVVLLGVHKAPVEVDLVGVLIRELNIHAAMAYPSEFPDVMAMLASGKVNPETLVSHNFALSEFSQAIKIAADPQAATKVLIDCQR